MAKEMTREDKLWTMTGVTLLGVAEKLGIKTSKSTLKQGKEKLIAKILEAENAANPKEEVTPDPQEEVAGDGTPYSQVLKEIQKDEKKAVDKKAEKQAKTSETSKTSKTSKTSGRGALIEYDGRSQNICKWADELGVSANTLYGRIYHLGWSVEKAFTTPGRKSSK